jgi:hypothetical protein
MNTNAIIANYNVERYLSGATERIDVRQLESIGHSAVPALTRLEQGAKDEQVKSDARSIIDFIHSPYDSSEGKIVLYDYLVYGDWTAWNLERHRAMLSYEK